MSQHSAKRKQLDRNCQILQPLSSTTVNSQFSNNLQILPIKKPRTMSKSNLQPSRRPPELLHVPEGYPRIGYDDDAFSLVGSGEGMVEKGKSLADSRLLMLLEFFRQLYIRRSEVFKKIFEESHDEFVEMFKEVGAKLSRHGRSRRNETTATLKRSLSVGSQRIRSIDGDDQFPLRLERFKVRTVVPGGGGAGSGAQGDKGDKGDKSGTKSK